MWVGRGDICRGGGEDILNFRRGKNVEIAMIPIVDLVLSNNIFYGGDSAL